MTNGSPTANGNPTVTDPPPSPWGVAVYNVNPGDVTHEYDVSKDAMWSYYREHTCPIVAFMQKKGTSVLSVMRSSACEHFLTQTNAEWMLFIDSDIGFDCDSIDTMLEVCDPIDAPVVCGLYISSLPEGLAPVAWEKADGPPLDADWTRTAIDSGTRLVPVERTGAGFLMVHRDVLIAMHKKNPVDPWYGEMIEAGVRQGEDFTFCLRARDAGFPIHVDLGVNLIHVKTIHLNKNMLGNVRIITD